jgi:hypothetical protein
MFSIICVYNNQSVLAKYLLPSLERQSAKYQLILIDNSQNKFKSSAKIMNQAAKKALGKYLMFVHQDIMFLSNHFLRDIEGILDKIPNLGIAGAAGKSSEYNDTVTNVVHGNPPVPAGMKIKDKIEVQTLDSCLAIIPKEMFDKIQFDENAVRGWYFFIDDYCLSIKKLGFHVYTIPMDLYHRSYPRHLSVNFLLGLLRILYKHREQAVIYTTVGNWTLRRYFLDCFVRILAQWLKRIQ